MDIKKELTSIHDEINSLIKEAAYQVDPIKHKLENLNDKNKVIMAAIDDTIEMAVNLKKSLSPYIKNLERKLEETDDQYANRWTEGIIDEMQTKGKLDYTPLINESERAIAKVRMFASNIGDVSKILLKEVDDIKMQRELRFVTPARDAEKEEKNLIPQALSSAKKVLRNIIGQT